MAAGHELTAEAAAEILRRWRQRLRRVRRRHGDGLRGGGRVRLARRRRLPHGARARDAIAPLRFLRRDAAAQRRRATKSPSFRSTPISVRRSRSSISGSDRAPRPASLPGLFALHEELCRLPMKRLVEPAVRAARAGFPLTAFQAYLFTVIAPILTASPGVAAIFAPGRHADEGRRDLPQSGPRRDACMARRGRRAALQRWRCRARHRAQQARRLAGISRRTILHAIASSARAPILWRHDGATSRSIRRRRQAAR